MKFLLDVCVSSRSLQAFLVQLGYDTLSVLALDPRASDEQLLMLARKEDRVLVTEDDKDCGELVFVRKLPHAPIVRLVELSVEEQVRAVDELLERHAAALTGEVVVTVTRGRIRIRR